LTPKEILVRLRKLGHACLLVEDDGARVLIDPGAFSAGFEELTGLSAILVTHQHADHVDVARLPPLLQANPHATLYSDEGSAHDLGEQGIKVHVVHEGDVLEAGMPVRVIGSEHAVVHPDVPRIPNVGYLVAERLFHPGDALTAPRVDDLQVLALPTAAPWLKAAEAVDYMRQVRPRIAVPIHDAVLAMPQMFYDLFDRLAPADTEVRILDGEAVVEL
jgi:L-ascorbate metabolism protein UlaG (beta-lactamase superfamily)